MKISNNCFIWEIANTAIAIFAYQVSGRFSLAMFVIFGIEM